MTNAREAAEQRIRDEHALGQHERAVTLALETYGREVLSFLIARVGEQRGQDVFSAFLEDVWRGFPDFAWRSSLRTWLYMVARHAMIRYVKRPHHKRERFTMSVEVASVADRIRTETSAYLKTEVKDRFRELRAQLPDDDQTVLVLRIDRKLSWRELAEVMAGPDAQLTEDALETESARLRTKFKRAKDRLKELARAEGLLPTDEEG